MCKPLALLVLGVAGAAFGADEPIRVLLLTGENNHNWRYTSRHFEDTLEATGRFEVDVSDDPAATLADWDGLMDYRAIVLDYNGPRWGAEAEENFVKAVYEQAIGVVVIHAANNAFRGWAPYERMVGLLWRAGAGHGRFHEFDVEWIMPEHPIALGMPNMKAHPDELYHGLTNPQKADFDVIAVAHSSKESGGSGREEPMALVSEFGEAKVFHTPLGHVWTNVESTKASISDPQFRVMLARGTEWVATGACTIESTEDVRTHNTLTSEDQAAGWELLFDGEALTGMRGFRQDGFPTSGWHIEDALLATRGGGPDMITSKQYEDFEFVCEWKVQPGGNSGIIYLVTEDQGATYLTGPEMQVLDNSRHPDGRNKSTSAGALYAMIECAHDVTRPAGEWNLAMVRKEGDTIQHWLNGFKVVEYEIGSDAFNELVAKSKFSQWPSFGTNRKGHIALQAHGEAVWYRNIKVRELD